MDRVLDVRAAVASLTHRHRQLPHQALSCLAPAFVSVQLCHGQSRPTDLRVDRLKMYHWLRKGLVKLRCDRVVYKASGRAYAELLECLKRLSKPLASVCRVMTSNSACRRVLKLTGP